MFRFLITYRWLLILVAGVFTAFGVPWAARLEVDRSLERFFAADDPDMRSFRRMQQFFGGHEIVLVAYVDQATGVDRATRLRRATRDAQRVPGVVEVLSLATIPGLMNDQGEAPNRELRKLFAGYTHGQDDHTLGLVLLLAEQGATTTPRAETLRQLRTMADDLPQGVLIGEPALIDEGFRLIEEDNRRLALWCGVFLTLTLLIVLRSVRWTLAAVGVVVVTVVATRSLLYWGGYQLSLVSTTLPAVIMVIGVAAVLHFAVHTRSAGRQGYWGVSAALRAWREVARPTFFAIVTDVLGFLALTISRVQPVREFGAMAALGTLLLLPSLILVLPALAVGRRRFNNRAKRGSDGLPVDGDRDNLLRGSHKVEPAPGGSGNGSKSESKWRHLLRELPVRCANNRRRLWLATGLLAVLILPGLLQMSLQTDFTRNFRRDAPIVEDYGLVEKRLGGAGVWDIIVPAPDPLTAEFLRDIHSFETELRQEIPQVTSTLSVADPVRAMIGPLWDSATVARQPAVNASLLTMRGWMPQFYNALHARGGDKQATPQLRIMLRAPEQTTVAQKERTIDGVRRLAREHFPQATVTGYYVLLANLVASLNQDQWWALLLAGLAVLIVTWILSSSLRIATGIVVINGLPCLFVLSCLGWLDVPLNMGGAMIAAVSLGMAVDTSIHYLMSYQSARRRNLPPNDALRQAHSNVGSAIAIATFALVVGFATLVGSDFMPTVYFGTLMSITLIIGMACNLTLLPTLLKNS